MSEVGMGEVALAFTGWLNVHIPSDGRDAQRNLIRPLRADTFVAGTYLTQDCPASSDSSAHAGKCLIERLKGLQPLTALDLKPMLTRAQLRQHAEAAPAFGEIARGFRVQETFDGVVLFAPVLGNPNVSVMRELHDCSRALALIARHEKAREWQYSRVVFSRLEFRWVAPHPPLSVLDPALVWTPSGQNIKGVNDRHAVMPRAAAEAYFGRHEHIVSVAALLLRTNGLLWQVGALAL